ncbi:MAG TPA: hypothetical protein VGG91_11435 [Myxococcaceae bacterium]|jgi:hypothetical protein
MPKWGCVLAVLLSCAASAAKPQPPASQETILPAHQVGVGFGLGLELTPDGSTGHGLLRLMVAWSPLDCLEISFFTPGVSVLLGSRLKDEVVLSGGIDGFGYDSVGGFIVVPAAGVGYRHWFSSATSLGVSGNWRGEYGKVEPVLELSGNVFLTQTVGGVVSFNLALGAAGWPSNPFALTFGSGRLGIRNLPLFRVHLSDVWSFDLDARLILRLSPQTLVA